jgi:hypothetical protein
MNKELHICCQCGNEEESEGEYYFRCESCSGTICSNNDCVVFPTGDPQEETLCYDCAVGAGYIEE